MRIHLKRQAKNGSTALIVVTSAIKAKPSPVQRSKFCNPRMIVEAADNPNMSTRTVVELRLKRTFRPRACPFAEMVQARSNSARSDGVKPARRGGCGGCAGAGLVMGASSGPNECLPIDAYVSGARPTQRPTPRSGSHEPQTKLGAGQLDISPK